VIVFPKDAIGKTVVAEGVVYKVEAAPTEEMEHSEAEHKDSDKKEMKETSEKEEHAHAEGETCSPAGGYQIKGTGAIIK